MNLTASYAKPISLVRISDSSNASYPVTNAQAQAWARSDADFTDIIDEVGSLFEQMGNFSLRATTYTATYSGLGNIARLPYGPVTAVTSITPSQSHTLVGDEIQFDTPPNETFTVVYTAGFATVPHGIILAMKKAILSHFEDRQDNSMGSITTLPNHSRKLLMKFKRF